MALHESLESLRDSFKSLAATIDETNGDTRPFLSVYGLPAPAVDRYDLSNMATAFAEKIERFNDGITLSSDEINYIEGVRAQVILLQKQVANIYNGNAPQSVPVIVTTLSAMLILLDQYITPQWERENSIELMPRQLGTRIRGMQDQLKQIAPDLDVLLESVHLIRDARIAAQSLPTDLESLKKATAQVQSLGKSAEEDRVSIAMAQSATDHVSKQMQAMHKTAEALVQQLQDLHRVGTSTTLAGAFDERAKSLSKSVWGWLAILLIALGGGVFIGSTRVDAITVAMNTNTVNWQGVWINVVLTLFSVSAPVWLGWVATKQIIQRFRLAEDYAYKASISNAYEGYRREAVALDESFRDKLFDSALTRLDEVPGRLVDKDTHGSPFHELIASPTVREAINMVPNFAEKFSEFAKSAVDLVRKEKTTSSSTSKAAASSTED